MHTTGHGSRVSNDHGFTRPAIHFFVNIRYKLRLPRFYTYTDRYAHICAGSRGLCLVHALVLLREHAPKAFVFSKGINYLRVLCFLVREFPERVLLWGAKVYVRGHSSPIQSVKQLK